MADNTTLNSGASGDVIRDIDRAGIKTQVVAIDGGGASSESLVSATNGLPVDHIAATLSASTAYASSLVVKASAGTLYGISGTTTLTTGQWVQVHNTTSAPADTAVPKIILWIPAAGNWSADFGVKGLAFSTGITLCNSTTGPTKTIGVSDTWFEAAYK